MSLVNHQYRLAARPKGMPQKSDWSWNEEPLRELAAGELLVRVLYLSIDPAMRGWMNAGRSYIPPVNIGEVMRALAVGRIVESKHPHLKAGSYVAGTFGVQEYAISDGRGVVQVDRSLAPLPVFLSALGVSGLTAYFGLLEVGELKAGDTVVVSAAAGSVGMVAGQIAKLKGCPVVGIAGGASKCEYIVRELGFDAAVDYKNEDVKEALKRHCPRGVDLYFDNVGGDILDVVLTQLARGARVVICGAISQYNNTGPAKGPSNYLSLLVNRASMKGMVVFDYAPRYGEAILEMAGWMKEGKLKSREEVVRGLETFPETLLKLFAGENTGKLVLQIADDEAAG